MNNCPACEKRRCLRLMFQCDYHYWLRLLGEELERTDRVAEWYATDLLRHTLDSYRKCVEPNFYRSARSQP